MMDKHDRSYLNNVNLKNPWQFIALGFGSGLLPKAPGTYGSLAVIPFCIALMFLSPPLQLLVIVFTFFIGWYASNITEKAMGMHDNSSIVIDEFVGMFISVFMFPNVWWYAFIAFVFFRIFDVLKPFPISYLDKKVSGGLGVMLDDVLAGLFALACGHAFIYWFI